MLMLFICGIYLANSPTKAQNFKALHQPPSHSHPFAQEFNHTSDKENYIHYIASKWAEIQNVNAFSILSNPAKIKKVLAREKTFLESQLQKLEKKLESRRQIQNTHIVFIVVFVVQATVLLSYIPVIHRTVDEFLVLRFIQNFVICLWISTYLLHFQQHWADSDHHF